MEIYSNGFVNFHFNKMEEIYSNLIPLLLKLSFVKVDKEEA